MLPLDNIRSELFASEKGAEKVRAAYNLSADLHGSSLESAMWEVLGQAPRESTDRSPSNAVVFKAAALALASNMRSWAKMHARLNELERACRGYEPSLVANDVDATISALATILTGQSGKGDRTATVRWAMLLDSPNSFAAYLEVMDAEARRALEGVLPVSEPLITAVVAGAIGFDLGHARRTAATFGFPSKAPGMGGPLASEFLRNLGWSGFKPDRHIMRLFDGWTKRDSSWETPSLQAHTDSQTVLSALGVRNSAFKRFLYYSRLGELTTPSSVPVTRADQLVWLYGSLLHRKPRRRLKENTIPPDESIA